MCLGSLFCICIFSYSSQHHLFKKLSLFHCNIFASLSEMSWPCFSSIQFSHSVMSDSLWPRGLQHATPPCPSAMPEVHPNSCPLCQWCHPTIYPLSSPSPPALNLSQHWVFSNESASGGQSIGVSALTSGPLQWTPMFRGSISCHSILFFFGPVSTILNCFRCSVAKSYLTLLPHGLQHTMLSCHSPSPEVSSNSCPLNWWCHPTTSSSVTHFSSQSQSFPAMVYFPMSQLFILGGQIIGALASASVLPINIQGWFPFRLTGLIFLHSKGLSRALSINFLIFSLLYLDGPTLTSIHDHWKNYSFDCTDLSWQSDAFAF